MAILKQLESHFKAKHEKGVGTPFPRVPAPLHPCSLVAFNLLVCSLVVAVYRYYFNVHLKLLTYRKNSLYWTRLHKPRFVCIRLPTQKTYVRSRFVWPQYDYVLSQRYVLNRRILVCSSSGASLQKRFTTTSCSSATSRAPSTSTYSASLSSTRTWSQRITNFRRVCVTCSSMTSAPLAQSFSSVLRWISFLNTFFVLSVQKLFVTLGVVCRLLCSKFRFE